MKALAWSRLSACTPDRSVQPWLESMLVRNENCKYLSQFGRPVSQEAFRANVPLVDYEQLQPWIKLAAQGDTCVLFDGKPIAFERTGGSTGGSKLIPYTTEGLVDIRSALIPWLINVVERHSITGSAYFSLSPACREQENIGEISVGLSDFDYIGRDASSILVNIMAVPACVNQINDHTEWRDQTLHHLRKSKDLELISAWSPTFLLRLFEGEDTTNLWPNLKVISCWADGASAEFAAKLQNLFPYATIEPKGLMSTEAVITIPDKSGIPTLTDIGFFEFRHGENIYLENELELSCEYEAIITTANGLYRYCTGDIVRYEGRSQDGLAVLQFMGRKGLFSDLVGEKLTENFVASCLKQISGFRMLIPNTLGDGYTLIIDQKLTASEIDDIELLLMQNPQYAYARKLGQLSKVAVLLVSNPWCYYESEMVKKGMRLGDIKPVSLRSERYWIKLFKGES